MKEITEAAYQRIRDFIENNWIFMELRDENDVPFLRISTSDSRLEWTHQPNDRILELTARITGSDPDIQLPQNFAKSVIYDVGDGGDELSANDLSPFTMLRETDSIVIQHRIHVPLITN